MPKEINTIEDLDDIRNDLTEDYILKRDLDFNDDDSYDDPSNKSNYTEGEGWEPIKDFNGTIDGDGHTIKNLYRDSNDEAGLLGETSEDFTIKNLGLVDIDLTGSIVGSIVTSIEGGTPTIKDSFVTGQIEGSFLMGGAIGLANTETYDIKRTYTIVDMQGAGSQGGFIGQLYNDITDTGGLYSAGLGANGFGYSIDGEVETAYYDEDKGGVGILGTPLITDWMQGDRAEAEMEGFNFEDDWMPLTDKAYFEENDFLYRIEGGDGYPVLKTFRSIRKQLDAQGKDSYITEPPKVKFLRTYYAEFTDYEENEETKGIDVVLSQADQEETTSIKTTLSQEEDIETPTFLNTILIIDEDDLKTDLNTILIEEGEQLMDLNTVFYNEIKQNESLNTVIKDKDGIPDNTFIDGVLIEDDQEEPQFLDTALFLEGDKNTQLSTYLTKSNNETKTNLRTTLYLDSQEESSTDTVLMRQPQEVQSIDTYITDEGKEKSVKLSTVLFNERETGTSTDTVLMGQPQEAQSIDTYLWREGAERFIFLGHTIQFKAREETTLTTTLIGKMDIESTNIIIEDIEQIFKEFSQPADLIKPIEKTDSYGRAYEIHEETVPVEIIIAPQGQNRREVDEFGESNYGQQTVYLKYEYEKHGEKFKPKNGDKVKDSKGKEWRITETNRWRWNYRLVFYKVDIRSIHGEK